MALFQSPPTLPFRPEFLLPSLIHDIPDMYLYELSTNPKRANQIIQPSYTSFSNNDETRFEIEIPGAAQQDVSLELNDRKLELTAKRYAVEESRKTSTPAAENSDEEGSGMKSESVDTDPASAPVLKYHLVMKLGPRSNFDAISSQLSNGVLSIRIPHAAVAKPRSIQIGA